MIKVLINGVACPTVENDSILVNKRITDIENPEAKTADWTQTFLIQDTSKTRILFGQIFQVNLDIQNVSTTNFTPDFNPNLKAAIVVLNENTVVFTGFCQMHDIIIYRKHQVRYSINAYATIGNFFNDIRNGLLSDLDFSYLNHSWTRAEVISSWSPTLGEGYTYPMNDYGAITNYDQWTVAGFRPALFYKAVLDRIFSLAGWSYSSAFFTSTRFKSMLMPFTSESLFIDATEITDRSFLVGRATSALTQVMENFNTPYTPDPIIFNADSGPLAPYSLFNTSGADYDTATGKYTCDVNGNYKFGFSLNTQMVDNTGTIHTTGTSSIVLIRDVGGVLTVIDIFHQFYTFSGGASTSLAYDLSYTSAVHHCNVGEVYYLGAIQGRVTTQIPYSKTDSNGSNISIIFNIGSAFSLIAQPEIGYGDTVYMNTFLPKDIKTTEFIMGLAKLFNLQFDQIGAKTLLIEPHDDYYTSDIVDWTQKIDVGQDVRLIPMGMNNQKKYNFTYEEDSDLMNKKYKDSYQKVYGSHIEEVNNDFLTETKEIKPIFAATVLSNAMSGTNDRIISDMRFANEDGSDVKVGTTKLRILYWGGLINCNTWNFRNEASSAIDTANDRTSYPYAGHLDHPYVPTFDLCYGLPECVYYDYNIGAGGNPGYTDNNLYSAYWDTTIKQLTNKNSKVLEAMFRLNITDFINIDFRKQYFIREAYYRLLEVIDYDITGLYLVKCRLLKVDKIPVYISSYRPITGGNDVFDSGANVPTRTVPKNKDGRVQRWDKAFEGSAGYVTGENTVNKGSRNVIPNAAYDSYVFGSDDTVVNFPRTFVFNSDGAVMNRDGAMFNGVDLERKFEFTADQAFMMLIDSSTPFDILPPVAANEKYVITGFYGQIGAGTTNYTSAGNVLLKIGVTNISSIGSAEWTGVGEDAVIRGSDPAFNSFFSTGVTIQVTNIITAGDRDIRFVIFYKILTI